MSYIGATGLKTTDLIEEAEEKSLLASLVNSATDVITDDIKTRVEDAILSYFDTTAAAAEWRPSVTDVLSATGQLVSLGVLGELKMNKLDRSSVQDVNSMVYTDKSQSTVNNIYWTDKVKIRYDNNYFSNAFYYEGGVKKGEILTSRINLLPVNNNNIDLYTATGKIGIGTATPATPLHIYNATDANIRLETLSTGTVSIDFQRGTINDVNVDYRIVNNTGRFSILSQDEVNLYTASTSEIIRFTRALMTNFKDLYNAGNIGVGITPTTPALATAQIHIYNSSSSVLRLETTTTGTSSIEFQRGAVNDANVDYRIICESDLFKIQSQDATNLYTAGTMELMRFSTSTTTNYKDFTNNGAFNNLGNVNISTTGGTSSYKLNVEGDVNITGIGKKYFINNSPIVSSQWTTAGTTIEYSGGSVGIGTLASYKLNVGGTINGDGLITAQAGITISTGQTLTLSGTAGITSGGLITANGGITTSATGLITANGQITRLTGVVADGVKSDLLTMANSLTTPYSIKFVQHRITSTDFRYYLTQTNLGTEYTNPSLSFKVGNVGIGTNNPINILQVGQGGRLRIANSLTDYTIIGTADADGSNNTQIVLSGATRTTFLGSIQYYASTTGDHIFSTAVGNTLEKMTIKSGGNVGIGTTNPQANLHINNNTNNTTALTIENSFTLGVITSSPAPTSTGTTGIYSYMVLTYTTPAGGGYYDQSLYTITSPVGGLTCDVLMVGGGGAGGRDIGGGGGGGAVLYAQNVTIPAGTHNLYVGRGAVSGESRAGSTIGFGNVGFGVIVYGGSSAGNAVWANATLTNSQGASDGGGKSIAGASQTGGGVYPTQKGTILASATVYSGSSGGTGGIQNNQVQSGGGGGAGGVGGNGSGGSTNPTGYGGVGVMINITGTDLWWGGGGGGGSYITNPPSGGRGGGGGGHRNDGGGQISIGAGGADAYNAPVGMNDGKNTGGGGGGGGYTTNPGGTGGDGVIIIRWVTPKSNSTINLITGITNETDYKVGNYNGDFTIKKMINSVDTDILTYINATGNFNFIGNLFVNGSRPSMWMGSATGNGSGVTNDINIITSSVYNYYVQISINDLVISHSIIWKNNSSGLSNYYTFNDGSYYVSLVQNLAPYGEPNTNRYTFWRRSGTFVWRVQEFL